MTPQERHYAVAANEYDAGWAPPGLVAMAEAKAGGDPARSRAVYLRLRAAQLAQIEAERENERLPEDPAPSTADRPPAQSVGSILFEVLWQSVVGLVLIVVPLAVLSQC